MVAALRQELYGLQSIFGRFEPKSHWNSYKTSAITANPIAIRTNEPPNIYLRYVTWMVRFGYVELEKR